MVKRIINPTRWCAALGLLLLLCGCVQYQEETSTSSKSPSKAVSGGGPAIDFKIAETSPSVKGAWVASSGSGNLGDVTIWVTINLSPEKDSAQNSMMRASDLGPLFGDATNAWKGSLTLRHDAGVLELRGKRDGKEIQGQFVFTPNADFVHDVNRLLQVPPSTIEFFQLMLRDVGRAEISQFVQAVPSVSAAEICSLKDYGVTPGYMTAVLKGGDFSIQDIRKMRSYQVPENFPAEIRRAGWRLTSEEIVRLRSYNVSSQEMAGWIGTGYHFNSSEIVRLHSYGVSPGFGATVRELYDNSTSDELIRIKSYGLSEEYLKGIKASGAAFPVQELIRLKSYNVSPDEISAWQKIGYQLKSEELIRLHSYQVSPEYAKALNSTNFNVGELVKLKSYGVSPNEVGQWLKAGYQFTAQDLVKIHAAGVPPEYAAALNVPGRKPISADTIIRLRQRGFSVEEIRELRE